MTVLSHLNLLPPIVTPGSPVARSLPSRFADVINVRDLGTGVGAGSATVDTAAFTLALSLASSTPGSIIYMPAATYTLNVTADSTGFLVPSGTTLVGDGGDKTIITWADADGSNLFGAVSNSTVRASGIAFENFSVRGTWSTRGNATAYPFLMFYVDGLRFTNIISEYSRIDGIDARNCTDIDARGCIVRYAGSDGVNFTECAEVSVIDNDFLHIDGDAICVDSDSSDIWGVRKNIIVTGNRIFDAQGIKILSARHATISANTLDAVRTYGVNVSTVTAPGTGLADGMSTAAAISICGNTITNLVNRANVDNLSQGCPGIIINGLSARVGTYAAIPGEPNTTTATIIDPYREIFANSTATSVPTGGSFAIIVSGNTIARTLPACNSTDARFTEWSSYGFGEMFTRNGWVNPSLSESDLRDAAILISGGVVRDVLVTGNMIRGMDCGLTLTNGVRYDNVVFRGNEVIDCYSNGVLINTAGKLRLYVDDNLFDLDPFCKHVNRGSHGTWQVATAPLGINQETGSGVYVRRNTFRNMAADFNGAVPMAGFLFDGNTIEAQPSVFGTFNTTNKGMGLVRLAVGAKFTQVDSDPGSTTFGTILAMPVDPNSWGVITTAYTVQAYDHGSFFVDTTSGAISVTLPSSPIDGTTLKFLDSTFNWASNNLTLLGNGATIAGAAQYVANTSGTLLSAIFKASRGWYITKTSIS